MPEIAATEVKKLRDRTSMPFGKCREALIEANGDLEKAVDILRKQSKDAVNKVGGRETAEGRIGLFIDPDKQVGALVEVRCESAPVAKNERFAQLANEIAKQVALKEATTPEALLAQAFVDDPKHTVADRIAELVALMRENVQVKRMVRMTGLLGGYVHFDGTLGTLVQAEGAQGDPQMLRDVAIHAAGRNPMVCRREDLPKERLDKEAEIAQAQAVEEAKAKKRPAEVVPKIAEGKLRAWMAENIFTEQKFVKDETKTVGDLLKSKGLKLVRFARLKVGEVTG
jgi:elongation factor Ts